MQITNEPTLVVFGAPWCNPCKASKPLLKEFGAENENITFVEVNVDDNPDIARHYSVMSVPTVVAFNGGEETGRVMGRPSRQDLEKLVENM
jgi:thioredoxin 1